MDLPLSEANARATVMIIDGDSEIREAIALSLTHEGYGVVEATNGSDALARLAEWARLPALVLLDLMMPRMTGDTFFSIVARTPRLATLPIVIVSADGSAGRRTGHRVLKKPFDLSALLGVVSEACASSALVRIPSDPTQRSRLDVARLGA